MRPLKITMQAFGSYGAQETVDLTKAHQNLFLVFGDTGSGKTTIFDAMVYAIYGETGSLDNKKGGIELQSQFASRSVAPFVELEFLEKGERYTVRREPMHFKATAKNAVSERVSLLMPDGSEYPTKETNKKLVELVGLTREQFLQVAMIAQGEFVKLLRATSNERKGIFRKLFNTECFSRIADELKARKDEKETEKKNAEAVCRAQLPQLVLSAEDPGEAQLAELRGSILGGKELSVTDMERLLGGLEALLTARKERQGKEKELQAAAEKAKNDARDAVTAVEGLQQGYQNLDNALLELEACDAEEPEMAETAVLIRRIDASWQVKAEWERFREAEQNVSATEQKLEEQKNLLPGLKAACEAALKAAKEAESSWNAETAAFSGIEEQVKAARKIFKSISDAEETRNTAQKKAEQASEALQSAAEALVALEEQEKNWRRLASELQEIPALLERCRSRIRTADALGDELAAVKTQETELETACRKAKSTAEEYRTAAEEWKAKNAEYLRTQERFLNAQAGILAREMLRPGQPCPVCGALEHPVPCKLPEDAADLKQEQVNSLKTAADALLDAMQTAASKANAAASAWESDKKHHEASLEKLRGELSALIPELPSQPSIREMEKHLEVLQRTLEKEKTQLEQDSDRLEQARKALETVEPEKQKRKETLAKKTAKADLARGELASAEATLQHLYGERQFETEQAAEEALKQAEERRTSVGIARNKAAEYSKEADTALSNAGTLIESYGSELPKLRETLSLRRAAAMKLLAEKGADAEDWETLVQDYSREDMPALQEKLTEHVSKRTAAETRRKTALEGIADRERPDMEVLSAKSGEAQKAWEEITATLTRTKEFVSRNDSVFRALKSELENRNRLAEEYTRINHLYQSIAGKRTGERMDLETYVQRYYLERALVRANVRFREMSAGQYELRLCPIEQAGSGANHGLDLMVYSFVTGLSREVRTLSGGESFMAALSLALGMSDQIQASSAAVQLDMMFIDEGFGSLDENSRKQAVRVLKDMAGSSRLIGIISHVAELKQEIDDQLLVTKDEQGSHTRWQLS